MWLAAKFFREPPGMMDKMPAVVVKVFKPTTTPAAENEVRPSYLLIMQVSAGKNTIVKFSDMHNTMITDRDSAKITLV